MATLATQWPSAAFPDDVKALLARFFELIESQEADVGQKLADEVFTPTGMTQSGVQKFSGSAEIIASRTHAWSHISSRKHTILRVFEGDVSNPGRDIMLQATLELELKNAKKLELEFGARAVVVDWEGCVKLQSFVVWTDSAPLREALTPPRSE